MREYEDETSDVTGRDVCCAWLIVVAVLSVVLVLPVLLQAGATWAVPFL
jgi:hypothetical protein